MMAIAVLAVQILAAAALPAHPVPPPGVLSPSAHLRGISAPAAAPAASPAASATAPFVDERGPRGHFYYSDACEDCVYKGAQCGCQAAVEYFACLTKHCHAANHSKFAQKCAEVSTNCSSELDIACSGPDSTCKAKYNQLPSGGIGLTLDLDGVEDDAYCGPYGKCMGTVHMKAIVHNPAAGGPAPAPAPAPGPATTQPVFLECGLPNVADADVDNQTHWTLCRAPVVGDKATCDLPMVATLKAGEGHEAYCVLTEGTVGNPPKRLTQPAWHLVSNTHDKAPNKTTEGSNGGFFSWLPWMGGTITSRSKSPEQEAKHDHEHEHNHDHDHEHDHEHEHDHDHHHEHDHDHDHDHATKAAKAVALTTGPGHEDCPCIGIDNVEGETVATLKDGSTVPYPADLGGRCEAWDLQKHPSCPGASWCKQQWCYVDPCNCKNVNVLPKPSIYLKDAQYQGKPVHFSYATCGGKDSYSSDEEKKKTAEDIEKTCAVKVDAAKFGAENCRCIGVSPQPGTTKVNIKDKMVAFPADTGAVCNTWEMDNHPDCDSKMLNKPAWCSQSWCYVDPCSCTLPTPPKTSSYLPESTYKGKPVYFSYATCGGSDKWTAVNKKETKNESKKLDCSK